MNASTVRRTSVRYLFRDLTLTFAFTTMDVIPGKGKEKESSPITENGHNQTSAKDKREQEREEEAAIVVQRAWRHHSMKKTKLTSDARWKDALVSTKMQVRLRVEVGYSEKSDGCVCR